MKRLSSFVAFGLAALASASVFAELRISAICPRPGVLDAAGKESGWVDLVNDGSEPVNLAEYELVRVNRGKKLEPGAKKKNLAKGTLAAGATLRVWTSEEYANCKDLGGSGNVEVFDGRMVYPAKVNPKKFPYLALYHKTDVTNKLDGVVIPVDIVDGGVFRRDMSVTTRYAWNIVTNGVVVPYGPNVSPLYGVKHDFTDLASTPLAQVGVSYPVSLPVNPLSELAGDAIRSVTLEYSSDFGAVKTQAMTPAGTKDKARGVVWSAAIPAVDIPAPGRLLRWRAKITDGDGNVWTSPSFKNPDDGYQWYGTITEPGVLADAKLQTWHMFVEGDSVQQMDIDTDKQDRSKVPYNARVGIYDGQTGTYYDNVRIDLRGNTSGTFRKKSHGFRFSKCQPMKCTNTLEDEAIEIRKTSLVAEYCDPAYVRQSLAFHLFRKVGCRIPFHYPVRVNLNGEFYQLAFHSARFSDELIEDYYGLDPLGYGYKNSGCLTPSLKNWVTCEKKTPDDGVETGSAAMAPLKEWTTRFGSSLQFNKDDQPIVTRAVVETFDLPAWINYLAAARITMECDDSWANLSTYWDKNGTGTWMPLGYDMNQSLGHIYFGQWGGAKDGLYAELDQHKAHPLFGGTRVLCYFANGNRSHEGSENYALEAVWQSTKFRRLYLRRLRTLMDTELGAPGTPKEETPIWQYVVAVTNATWECAQLDYAKWRASESNLPAGSAGTFWTKTGTYAWSGKVEHAQGVDDLWEQYIVPRRRHLYETHSVHNTAKGVGYGQNLSAGIPDAPIATTLLVANFELVGRSSDELILRNNNAESVDLSGWKLAGAVDWTLPAGTVVDAGDLITIVADRKSWVSSHLAELGDRVVVGNATFTEAAVLTVEPAARVGSAPVAPFVPESAHVPGRDNWFDAQAQDYATGADMTALEVPTGSFSAEGNGAGSVVSQLGLKRFDVSGSVAEGDKVIFTPATRQMPKRRVVLETTVLFPDALVELPESVSGFASFTLMKQSDGTCAFAIHDGAAWRILGHELAPAETDAAYKLRMTLNYRLSQPMIVYSIRTGSGWVDLATADGQVAFPVSKSVERVAFSGYGEIGGFSADYWIQRGFTIHID